MQGRSTMNAIAQRSFRKLILAALSTVTVVALTLLPAETALGLSTIPLHGSHVGANSATFGNDPDDGGLPDPVVWHFVLNGLDSGSPAGQLTATFASGGTRTAIGIPRGAGRNQHFYVGTSAHDVLLSAFVVVDSAGGRLVLSHVSWDFVPPADDDPPVNEDPPVNDDPPTEEDPPVDEEPPIDEDPPVHEDPPVDEDPPVNEDPPTEEDPPVNEDPPVEEEPPIEEEPPVDEEPPVEEEDPLVAEEEIPVEGEDPFLPYPFLPFTGDAVWPLAVLSVLMGAVGYALRRWAIIRA